MRAGQPATVRPEDVPQHAGRVVRRMLLRRGLVVDQEFAQLIADAVRTVLQNGTPARPQRRGSAVPGGECEPLF